MDSIETEYKGYKIKPKRFRLRGLAPLNSDRWKCSWLDCAHGMGLAGRGSCSARGEWWNADCPKYQTEEELLKEWGRRKSPNNDR